MCHLYPTLALLLALIIFTQFASCQQKDSLGETTTWLAKNLPILAIYNGAYKNPPSSLSDPAFTEKVLLPKFNGCNCELTIEHSADSRITRRIYSFWLGDIDPEQIKIQTFMGDSLEPAQRIITLEAKQNKESIRATSVQQLIIVKPEIKTSYERRLHIVAKSEDAGELLAKALRQAAQLCQRERQGGK